MNSFRLLILSAERPFIRGDCRSLVVTTSDGPFGIMANHSNMIAAIVPGLVKIRMTDGKTQYASVSEGILKVEDGDVLVLVDTIERPDEIDERMARRKLQEDREALLQRQSREEYQRTKARMARSLARLKAKRMNPL